MQILYIIRYIKLYNIVNYGDLLIKNNVIKQGFQLNKSEQDPR